MNRVPLSSAAHAAALVAVGFPRQGLKLEALNNTSTGEQRVTWHLECPNAADAADLLRRSRPEDRKSLWKESPSHPFLAALLGALNFDTLTAWRANPDTGISGMLYPGGKLLRIQTGAIPMTEDFLRQVPAVFEWQTPELAFAAALIAVGFVPRATMNASGAIALPMASVLYPEITATAALDAAKLMQRPDSLIPAKMPGPFAPGMHPFQYAFSAAWNLASVPQIVAAAQKKPVHFFKQQKSAMASDAALNRPGFEAKLAKHIAGFPV